jgi:predicted transcriptional regulator
MENVEELINAAEVIDEESTTKDSLYGFPIRERDNRVVDRSQRKVYDIKRLWSRNKEILQLDSMGYKATEIAKILNITPTCVSMTLNSTLGKEAQLAIRDERDSEFQAMRESVMELTWKSLKVYEEILDSEVESTKLKKETADTVALELAGMRAPTKIQSMTAHAVLTPDELNEFKKRGFEAARRAGKLIEVEGESTKSAE